VAGKPIHGIVRSGHEARLSLFQGDHDEEWAGGDDDGTIARKRRLGHTAKMTPLIILSHNAFWFQGVPFATDVPREPDAAVLNRLCAIYRQVHADVICLQEIQSQDAFEMVATQLGMPGCYCPGTTLPQYGGAVFWRPGQGSRVQDARTASLATQRMWQIVDIHNGNGRLRVGNIHLPSSRQLGPDAAQAQRIAELRDAITICEERPDVIAGDLNEQPAGPVNAFLRSHAYRDAAVLAKRADAPTTLGANRGDYIWISKKIESRVSRYTVLSRQALACTTCDKEYVSDHFPLWITVGAP